MSTTKPTVTILLPPDIMTQVVTANSLDRLSEVADVLVEHKLDDNDAVLAALRPATACLTGWGTPRLSVDLLAQSLNLRLIAHTAGSVRHLVDASALTENLRVTHAAAVIAESVAEYTIGQILCEMRSIARTDRILRHRGSWEQARDTYNGRLLGNVTVGVVGASRTGRAVIQLLHAFGSRVLVADPYLDAAEAARLNVELRPLQELLAESDVVSLHAPLLPATEKMIGADELRTLRDGALLVNCGRGGLIDEKELIRELQSGRFRAALDVFEQEPLSPDSPLRTLENVLITSHNAGNTADSRIRQGDEMTAEVVRFLNGDPLKHEISKAMYSTLA